MYISCEFGGLFGLLEDALVASTFAPGQVRCNIYIAIFIYIYVYIIDRY